MTASKNDTKTKQRFGYLFNQSTVTDENNHPVWVFKPNDSKESKFTPALTEAKRNLILIKDSDSTAEIIPENKIKQFAGKKRSRVIKFSVCKDQYTCWTIKLKSWNLEMSSFCLGILRQNLSIENELIERLDIKGVEREGTKQTGYNKNSNQQKVSFKIVIPEAESLYWDSIMANRNIELGIFLRELLIDFFADF